jgi:phosphoribosylformylglycinamidine cyclo-ligase
MSTYADAGIDLDSARQTTRRLGEIVAKSRGQGVLADVGAFGGMFHLGAVGEYRDPVLVASTDGIGTKVKVASALGRYENLGADIVNHCVNDIAVQGARPLFFLDYLALHRADPEVVTTLVGSVASACAAAGCALLGGETAEMPDVYAAGEFDLAGTIVGVLERDAIGANGEPQAGDIVLGLPSDGLHTNGYSLARRALPFETWQKFDANLGMSVGEALLAPHRSYLSEIQALLGTGARSVAHITGGGLPENVERVVPGGLSVVINTSTWEPLPIFSRIAEGGGIPISEMFRVFNMGVGLVAIVPSERLAASRAAVPAAIVIGQIETRKGREAVVLRGVEHNRL